MSPAHIHLMLNHVPVLGVLLGLVLTLINLRLRDKTLTLVTLALFILVALMAIPVFYTGGPTEEAVENLPGVAESLIERHEEAALRAYISAGFLGLVSLLQLFLLWRRRPTPKLLPLLLGLAALITTVLMIQTAYFGGQIHHPELRPDPFSTLPTPKEQDAD